MAEPRALCVCSAPAERCALVYGLGRTGSRLFQFQSRSSGKHSDGKAERVTDFPTVTRRMESRAQNLRQQAVLCPGHGWWLGSQKESKPEQSNLYKCRFRKKEKKKKLSEVIHFPSSLQMTPPYDTAQTHFTHQKSLKSHQVESLYLKYCSSG